MRHTLQTRTAWNSCGVLHKLFQHSTASRPDDVEAGPAGVWHPYPRLYLLQFHVKPAMAFHFSNTNLLA